MLNDSKEKQFQIRFWGVRGSIPSPGHETLKYGGNTSCVEIRCGDNLLILDAGTGLRLLGDKLTADMPLEATILLSHAHWDHIQGFPFFVPGFIKGNTFHIYGPKLIEVEQTLRGQMMHPNFPVTLDAMQADIQFHDLKINGNIDIGEVNIYYDKLNHPGGVTTFQIHYNNKTMLYATDTEHYSCIDQNLVKLAKNIDLLIYDAQYTPDEYNGIDGMSRAGWGHSTWEEGVKIAKAANVKQLILFHHDPSHNDKLLDAIQSQAQSQFKNTFAAHEGMEINLI